VRASPQAVGVRVSTLIFEGGVAHRRRHARVRQRDRGGLAGGTGVAALRARMRVAAGDPVDRLRLNLTADPERGVGARDQERAREAAPDRTGPGRRRRRPPGVCLAGPRDLRQLVDTLLEEILIGAQISQLIGLGRRQARQQRHNGGKPAERRHGGDSPLSGHCSPKRQKLQSSARRTRVPLKA
jgi:hypothetical protein